MAYATPGTVAAGDVATAAAWNVIANDIIQIGGLAQGVFTNEAARDAAITSPTEGMIVYLTAPTVPAATGTTTFIPSGIRTVYNGSVWVCVTPVAASTPAIGTTTSTTYTATLTGSPGTNPSITLVTGTTAVISLKGFSTSSAGNYYMLLSVAVSGASTIAASDDWAGYAYISGTNEGNTNGVTVIIPGLTAGTNTFTLNYRLSSATSTTFQARSIIGYGIA
jgi:hypothetical protein